MKVMKTSVTWKTSGRGLHEGYEDLCDVENEWERSS